MLEDILDYIYNLFYFAKNFAITLIYFYDYINREIILIIEINKCFCLDIYVYTYLYVTYYIIIIKF